MQLMKTQAHPQQLTTTEMSVQLNLKRPTTSYFAIDPLANR
jgi:hypothetical protein